MKNEAVCAQEGTELLNLMPQFQATCPNWAVLMPQLQPNEAVCAQEGTELFKNEAALGLF
jgi:hypothetical protein